MKTFLVTMEDAPETKWLSHDAELAQTIQYCAASLCISNSTGPRPKVTCQCIESKTAAEPATR